MPGALPVGGDGDRAEAVPVQGSAVDLHGGEGDVTDRGTVFIDHQRQGHRAGRSEGVDQEVFALVAVGMVVEGGCDQLADGVLISGLFISDQHIFP